MCSVLCQLFLGECTRHGPDKRVSETTLHALMVLWLRFGELPPDLGWVLGPFSMFMKRFIKLVTKQVCTTLLTHKKLLVFQQNFTGIFRVPKKYDNRLRSMLWSAATDAWPNKMTVCSTRCMMDFKSHMSFPLLPPPQEWPINGREGPSPGSP